MTLNHKPASADELLRLHSKRIELIRQCANESSEAEFQRKWLSVLHRCAQWFSTVPLTPGLHREPGGAFRATIETAFYALRLAGGQKFAADLTSEKRRRLEPQYNYGVFLSAVCSALDEPCRHFVISRVSDHADWQPAGHGPLGPWLGNAEYTVQRRPESMKPERMRTATYAQMIVDRDLLEGLDGPVLADMFGAINPDKVPQGLETLLHQVVRKAIDVSVGFERKAQQGMFAPVKFDVPSAVHVALELQAAPVMPKGTIADLDTGEILATAPTPASAIATPAAQPPATAPLAPPADGGKGEQAPALSRSLLDAIERSEAMPTASSEPANGVSNSNAPRPIDPATLFGNSPAKEGSAVSAGGPTNEALKAVLGNESVMILEFFRALAQDVADGKASVQWEDKGLVLQKRLIGAYGVTSNTLIEEMRKRSLLLRAAGNEICIVEKAGCLIQERPAA
jgi:conjugal transfer pilus assembly protein TraI